MTTPAELQSQYIEELRAIAPSLESWWIEVTTGPRAQFAQYRWPTGPSGHPKVLAIFRKYFLLIEDLNWENRAKLDVAWPNDPEDMWGEDDMGNAPEIEKPVDWLIHDIPAVAPDIDYLARGIVFVPIGLDENEVYA